MAEPIACPLCGGPTEEHEAYRDRACPKCGLCAPPDVLERIEGQATGLAAFRVLDAEQRQRIAALEAELAQLKHPAHVLAEAERLLRAVFGGYGKVDIKSFGVRTFEAWLHEDVSARSLADAYAKLTGGDRG